MDAAAYYVFVATDISRDLVSLPSGLSVAKACRAKRVWGLGGRTLYRNTLKPHDRALIYIAGAREYSQAFVAEATILGLVQSIPVKIGPRLWPSTIPLKDFHWFRSPVFIHPILAQLDFIPDPENKKWGAVLQGAVLRITARDYELITRTARLALPEGTQTNDGNYRPRRKLRPEWPPAEP